MQSTDKYLDISTSIFISRHLSTPFVSYPHSPLINNKFLHLFKTLDLPSGGGSLTHYWIVVLNVEVYPKKMLRKKRKAVPEGDGPIPHSSLNLPFVFVERFALRGSVNV